MPSLTLQEIDTYCPFKTRIFVETGTYMGDTIYNVKSAYEKVYSIELNKSYVERAMRVFEHDRNVHLIHGDSSECMGPLCRSIDAPTFFWLDGHWSGGCTARGAKDCPLLEEIASIVENCKPKCVIAIDDVRLFGTHATEDWSTITRDAVLKLVGDRLETCTYFPSDIHPEDRMVLVLREKN